MLNGQKFNASLTFLILMCVNALYYYPVYNGAFNFPDITYSDDEYIC